jgi:hypothetical protein
VLVVIDDLHAADDASLSLLQLLAGDLHRMPALCLFTVRDTEPSRSLAQALARFDTDFTSVWRLATDVLHSPELQAQLRFAQACRYLLAGDVGLGADIAERSFQDLAKVTATWHQPSRFVHDSCQMLITGTLGDHAEQMADQIVEPEHPSIPHLAAPAASLGFVQRGDTQRARDIVSRWFAPPPRSWTRIQAIAYWAQVAIELGIPDPDWLRGQLISRAGQLAIVGAGADCGGAVDSLLAGLAWRLGRLDEAADRARAGLALETRVGSRTWITRTEKLIARIGRTTEHRG